VQAAEAAAQQLRKACERQIAALLARLEGLTGCYVEGVHIRDDDVTTIADREVVRARRVVIDLKRAPGSRWET
jgi:hypothetical protein